MYEFRTANTKMNAPDNRRSRESFPKNHSFQTETSDTDSVLLWANVLLTQCHDFAILEEMGFIVFLWALNDFVNTQ